MITLTDIKLQLRLDEADTAEDALLARYYLTAKQSVANHVDRNLYEIGDPVPAEDLTALVVDEPLEQAMLLLIGHLYEHRESVSDNQVYTVPMAYRALLQPYRRMGV